MRHLTLTLLLLPLALGEAMQDPWMVSTTSCRSWPATHLPSPTQVTVKPSSATPSLTSLCATTSRPARVSLKAESGVYAYVYDTWGTCNQYIELGFNANWTQYTFGMAWYDDPNQGCNGVPTSTMSVSPLPFDLNLDSHPHRDASLIAST